MSVHPLFSARVTRAPVSLWVVRFAGSRRVEVYEQGKPMRMALPGEELRAPGVLRNPVKVEALYDREAAMEATLGNLLQRVGYTRVVPRQL